jgi:FAD synthetase
MKVIVAGTFDIIHPGHIYFLREASQYGDLYVIIARDTNVKKIKGKKPIFDENERRLIIENMKVVKKTYLGDTDDFFKAIEEIDPDIIFLGSDQDRDWVKKEIEKRELDARIIQLDKRKKYSSSGTLEILQRLYRKMNEEGKGGRKTPPQKESIPNPGQ